MNTLGWVFILLGALVISTVSRGRVMQLPTDLSDMFLAMIRGDAVELTAVLKRRGDGNTADAEMVPAAVEIPATSGMGNKHEYKLGAVKPHVKAAADYFGNRFDIKTVYGWAATGSVPGSFHPKGRALDFMVSAKTDKAKGDALAAALIAGKDQWGVIEVIWNKKIWTEAKGWHDYHGPRDHTDHVHGSFTETHDIPAATP